MAKGIKTGGRKKGVPNKIASASRLAFMATFGALEGDLRRWIKRTAKDDPGRAADLLIKMASYHFPKKTELTGNDGGPVNVIIKKYGPTEGMEQQVGMAAPLPREQQGASAGQGAREILGEPGEA